MATSDGVHTWRLHFQEQDGEDQKKNADADVTCECTFKPTFLVKVKREVKSCPGCNQTGMSNRWTKAAVLRSQNIMLEMNTTLILEKVPIFLAWGHKGRS